MNDPVYIEAGDRLIVALPAPAFRVRFVADFAPPIGTQYFDGTVEPAAFRSDVAGARTFGYLHEVESLLARGLARGGSLENALVFAPDGPMQPLRWPDEAVRHKVLDLIGDLALLGAWPQCEIVADQERARTARRAHPRSADALTRSHPPRRRNCRTRHPRDI